MPLTFDASVPALLQGGNWQCSAAATAWLLRALGADASQDDVVNALGPDRIDPGLGLHDASGAGLVAMLRDTYGVAASNGPIDFDGALSLADRQPFVMGGAAYYHWVGVRGRDGDDLLIANPAPGYKGPRDRLTRDDFARLGPFYAVWPTDVVAGVALPIGAPTAAAPSNWVPLVVGGVALAWALELI